VTSLFTRTLVFLLIFAFVLVPGNVSAQTQPDPPPYVTVYDGTFTNAAYQIVVPNPISNWNGTLLVYAHGYAFGTETAAGDLSGTPAYNLAGVGYAVAGSAYRNTGWAVKEGLQNTLALTNRFNGLVGKPERTILIGFSMGSVIALKGIEQYPGIYDGAISACGIGGGTPVAVDLALDLALAYDVTFDWPEDKWGTPGDVKDALEFDPEVKDVLSQNFIDLAYGDPATQAITYAKFEFIRRVLDLPANDFYPNLADPVNTPGGFLVDMAFATQARAEMEQRANGPVSQNLDHVYSLSGDDIAFFAGLGVQLAGDPNVGLAMAGQWLADMNADINKYEAKRSAREYVERYAAFSGDLKRPVLTIHTTVDPINPPFHELLYAETVGAAGRGDLLRQWYTDGIGHCQFTPSQLLAVIDGMTSYLNSGTWPDVPNGGGFLSAYVPPPPYYRSPDATGTLGSALPGGIAAATPLFLPLASK
jgi:pimeloyl-ACP methyl ester carboxylesterase